jgi:hypothetical protein
VVRRHLSGALSALDHETELGLPYSRLALEVLPSDLTMKVGRHAIPSHHDELFFSAWSKHTDQLLPLMDIWRLADRLSVECYADVARRSRPGVGNVLPRLFANAHPRRSTLLALGVHRAGHRPVAHHAHQPAAEAAEERDWLTSESGSTHPARERGNEAAVSRSRAILRVVPARGRDPGGQPAP